MIGIAALDCRHWVPLDTEGASIMGNAAYVLELDRLWVGTFTSLRFINFGTSLISHQPLAEQCTAE